MAEPFLKINNISKTFKDNQVVKGVALCSHIVRQLVQGGLDASQRIPERLLW